MTLLGGLGDGKAVGFQFSAVKVKSLARSAVS